MNSLNIANRVRQFALIFFLAFALIFSSASISFAQDESQDVAAETVDESAVVPETEDNLKQEITSPEAQDVQTPEEIQAPADTEVPEETQETENVESEETDPAAQPMAQFNYTFSPSKATISANTIGTSVLTTLVPLPGSVSVPDGVYYTVSYNGGMPRNIPANAPSSVSYGFYVVNNTQIWYDGTAVDTDETGSYTITADSIPFTNSKPTAIITITPGVGSTYFTFNPTSTSAYTNSQSTSALTTLVPVPGGVSVPSGVFYTVTYGNNPPVTLSNTPTESTYGFYVVNNTEIWFNGTVTTDQAGTYTIEADYIPYYDDTPTPTATVTLNQGTIEATGITVNADTTYLTTLIGGVNSTIVSATVTPSSTTNPVTWTSSSPSVATVAPTGPRTAIVRAVSDGMTVITGSVDGYTSTVTITVSGTDIVAQGVTITATSPDYFTVNVTPSVNPAFGPYPVGIEKISIFTWSGLQQNDMDAKVAVRHGNTWSYTFPVNDTPANNFYYDADNIKINIYASTNAAYDGRMIYSGTYNWMNNMTARPGETVGYIAYCQDIGFARPTVFNGITAGTVGENRPLEGIRVSSSVPGVDVITSVHAADLGWLQAVPDGQYAGTMWQNRSIEAIRLSLEGTEAHNYQLTYRVHSRNLGWSNWVDENEIAGTTGNSLPIEAFDVQLIRIH